jgi:hypothetical protein
MGSAIVSCHALAHRIKAVTKIAVRNSLIAAPRGFLPGSKQPIPLRKSPDTVKDRSQQASFAG